MESSKEHVLIVGGLGLLGRQLAKSFAESGARVTVGDFGAKGVTPASGSGHLTLPVDIRDKSSVTRMIADAENGNGALTAVINCAYPRNPNYGRAVEDVTFEDFSENVSWHLGGYFLVTQQACAHFARSGGGSVINFSSIYGFMPPRFEVYHGTPMTMPVEYAAIKSAVLHLTRYFAQYYKKSGVRVNAVSPGGIANGQQSEFLNAYNAHSGAKGMLDPSDISGAVQFLASDASRYVTGQNIVVDDGFSL